MKKSLSALMLLATVCLSVQPSFADVDFDLRDRDHSDHRDDRRDDDRWDHDRGDRDGRHDRDHDRDRDRDRDRDDRFGRNRATCTAVGGGFLRRQRFTAEGRGPSMMEARRRACNRALRQCELNTRGGSCRVLR